MDTKKATNKQTTAAIASARQIPPIKRIFLITSRLSPSDRQLLGSHRPGFAWLHRFDYIGFRRREEDEVHGAPLSLQISCDLTHSIPLYSGPPQAGLTYDHSLAPFPAAPIGESKSRSYEAAEESSEQIAKCRWPVEK